MPSALRGPRGPVERPRGRGSSPREAIIKIQGDGLFIDAGTLDGFGEGAELEVFRRIDIVHPVTGRKLVDRFSIGAVTLVGAGSIISIIKV